MKSISSLSSRKETKVNYRGGCWRQSRITVEVTETKAVVRKKGPSEMEVTETTKRAFGEETQ